MVIRAYQLKKLFYPGVTFLTWVSLLVNLVSWWFARTLGFHFELTRLPPGLNWITPVFNTPLGVVSLVTFLLVISFILPHLKPSNLFSKSFWWITRFTTAAAVVGGLWFGWWTYILQVDSVDYLIYRPGWLVISVIWSPLNHAVYFADEVNFELIRLMTEEGYSIKLAPYQVTVDTAVGLVGRCPTSLALTKEAANLYVQEAVLRVLSEINETTIAPPSVSTWGFTSRVIFVLVGGLLLGGALLLYFQVGDGGDGDGGGESGPASRGCGEKELLFLKDLKEIGVDLF